MRTALKQVKDELGVEAVIMSNKKTANGVEIVAAVDNDAPLPKQEAIASSKPISQQPTIAQTVATEADSDTVASSLEQLLKRQQPTATERPAIKPMNKTISSTSEALNQKRSQQAKSEFEQWLSKARTTVSEQPLTHETESINDSVRENKGFDLHEDVEHLSGSDNPSLQQSGTNNIVKAEFGDDIADLRNEMSSIKQLLENQVSELMWQEVNRKSPVKAMLLEKLKDMGLSSQVSEHLSHFFEADVEPQTAWKRMLELLTDQLDTTSNEIITRGGVYSLVGPTGVGKTTTIAKLAARFSQIHGADKVGLITTDSFRIGALEQLSTYAKILNCPLKQVKDSEELSEAIYQLRNKKLILIDTAGMSQRDVKLTEKLNYLLTKSRVNIKNYLVLSATSQMSVLQESVQHFKRIPLSGCIFTKIDESLSLGELMSVAIHNRLPIGYLTNGQRVPEDIRVANSEKIVQKANQLYQHKQKLMNKELNKVEPKVVGMYDA